MEHDDRLDQRPLALLWRLESAGEQDDRVLLAGDRSLSLFLDKRGGRSHVFAHSMAEANEQVDVGADSEFWEFDRPDQARAAFDQMVEEARADGLLVERDNTDELGEALTDGPTTTEVGAENQRNS